MLTFWSHFILKHMSSSTYSGVQVKSWCNPKNAAQVVAGDPDGNMMVAVGGKEFAVHTLLPVNEEDTAAAPAELDSDDEPITDEATILVADSVFEVDLGHSAAVVVAACFYEDTLVVLMKVDGGTGKHAVRWLGSPIPDCKLDLSTHESVCCMAVCGVAVAVCTNQGRVFVLDVDSGVVKTVWQVGTKLTGLCFDFNYAHLWVADSTSRCIYEMTLQGEFVRRLVEHVNVSDIKCTVDNSCMAVVTTPALKNYICEFGQVEDCEQFGLMHEFIMLDAGGVPLLGTDVKCFPGSHYLLVVNTSCKNMTMYS
jgi:hypothetical protein